MKNRIKQFIPGPGFLTCILLLIQLCYYIMFMLSGVAGFSTSFPDIFFMLFFICVVVVLAYGIGCLGRKRKIGFGWAFAISLFLNPLIGLIVVLCSKEKIEFIDVDKK